MARARLKGLLARLRLSPLSPHWVAGLIFAATFLLFLNSHVFQEGDSSYSMLVSESLVRHGSVRLDYYSIPGDRVQLGDAVNGYVSLRNIYQIEVANGHLYYYFPPGTPVLSAPYVALMNLFGVYASNEDGTYNKKGEHQLEVTLAALLMAALTCVFFYTAMTVLPVGWSALVATGCALGSQVWSTASRAMWSDTWGTLLMGVTLWMLLAHETGRSRLRPVLLATVLSWSYFVRPTNSLQILAVSVYVLLFERRLFLRYALTGAAWLAGFFAYSWHNFGRLLPSYYRASRLTFGVFWTALAGHLVSPSRGLLVFLPWLLFVAYLLARYWRFVAHKRLVLIGLPVIAAHILVISSFHHWWGGHAFGPRLSTSLVPWFSLLAVLGVQAWLRWRSRVGESSARRAWRAQAVAGLALLMLGVFIHARGAMNRATWEWNVRRLGVDEHPEKIWDWRQPQFLAGILPPPLPRVFPPVDNSTVELGSREAEVYLWYGWSNGEERLRWTDGPRASLIFGLAEVDDMLLRVRLVPFVKEGLIGRQRVAVSLNGRALTTLELTEPREEVYEIELPRESLAERNFLTLELPDAASPKSLGISDDERRLGVAVFWISFQKRAARQ